jgi:hypothetical protein
MVKIAVRGSESIYRQMSPGGEHTIECGFYKEGEHTEVGGARKIIAVKLHLLDRERSNHGLRLLEQDGQRRELGGYRQIIIIGTGARSLHTTGNPDVMMLGTGLL